jgi:cyclomaltodextrinase
LDHYKKLIRLRRELPALRTGSFETMLVDDARQLYGFQRTLGEEKVLVVLNNSQETQEANLAVPGTWLDRLSGREIEAVEGPILKIVLPPRGAAVLVGS